MCGPLMLAASGRSDWRSPLVYQSGRLMTYVLLGGLLGGLGLGLRLWNAQGYLAFFSGALLLGFALLRWDPGNWVSRLPGYTRFQIHLRAAIGGTLQRGGLQARFALGACNGLLPCGLVYLAVVGAANTGSPIMGAAFMLAFGLGTLPLLSATLLAGRKLFKIGPATLSRWSPLVMATMGLFLVWRGWQAHVPTGFQNFQDIFFPPMCH